MKWFKVFTSIAEAKNKVPEGGSVLFRLGSRKVVLIHTSKDFYAIDDACPHQGTSLSKGTINYMDEIICPLHHYCYSLQFGTESEDRTRDLIKHTIELKDGGLYIGIDEKYDT